VGFKRLFAWIKGPSLGKGFFKKLSGCRAAIRYAESLVTLAEYAAWIEEGFFSE